MKVLLVVTGLANKDNPSGSSYNNRFALGLKNKGIDVTIVHLRSLSPKRLPVKFRQMKEGIEVIECSSFLLYHLKRMPLFLSILLKVQIRLIRKHIESSDIVHAISGGAVAPSYIISQYLNIPLISQFIGSDIAIQASYYQNQILFSRGLNASSHLCFNSLGLQNDFESYFKVTKPLKVLYRGIDLKEFQYTVNTTHSNLVVLFLGGFPLGNSNLKGGITLLEAINILHGFNFNRAVEIRIGGPNSLSQNFRQHMKQNLHNTNLKVNFIGAVQRKQVIEELKNSNIVLIPSLSEGIPNVLFEAMASGNSIIASRVGGIPEFLDDTNGILIDSNNHEILADSIKKLINDPELMRNLAYNARQKIEMHSYDNFLTGYTELYQNSIVK